MKLASERLLFCMNVREAKYEDTYITKLYTIILEDLVFSMHKKKKKLYVAAKFWEKLDFAQTEMLLGR